MAIKHIARQYDYIGLSTDDKSSITTDGAVIYYTDTQNREILLGGVWTNYVDNTSIQLAESDIQIGAVEIKDSDSDDRVEVFADGKMSTKASQDIHDDFNANANLQIGNVDVGGANPVPVILNAETVKVIGTTNNKYEDVTFHNLSSTPNAGLEFNVLDYKNLRISVDGDASSFTLLFRGQVGDIVGALVGIDSESLELASSTTTLNKIYEFDIEGYEKVWFGLSAVSGGSITVKGRSVN